MPTLERHHFALISIVAAVTTIVLKTTAWRLTGSVGLLSDAMESFVNLAGASFALWMIALTREPPDRDHPFGHGKAEYFSSGFEGVLILAAGVGIVFTGLDRLFSPQPLEDFGWGLGCSLASTFINWLVARSLARAGKRFNSIALQADSRHLMTDVWTSCGVVAGIGLVAVSGWQMLDPLIAIAVGLHILKEAYHLIRASADGLMDRSLEPEHLEQVTRTLASFDSDAVHCSEVRTRRAGSHAYVQFKLQVPGDWNVQAAHDLADRIEVAVAAELGDAMVVSHIEPLATAR
jgi:cation diffusion facilitator family transporter